MLSESYLEEVLSFFQSFYAADSQIHNFSKRLENFWCKFYCKNTENKESVLFDRQSSSLSIIEKDCRLFYYDDTSIA